MEIKIKNILGVAIIIVLLSVSYAVFSFTKSYSRSVGDVSLHTFTVSGEGKVVVKPDVAEFSFSVTTEGGKDLGSVQRENTKKINGAIDFLKFQGIDPKDIKTTSYNVNPRYQSYSCFVPPYPLSGQPSETNYPIKSRPCPPPEIVGYTVMESVDVKVRNFDKIGAVLSGIVEKGANTVSQLSFTIDDQNEPQNQARSEAIAKAKAKAEVVASAAGFKLGRIISIEEGFAPRPYFMGVAKESVMGGGGGVPAPAIEAGSEEVVVDVTLQYEIK